MNWERSLPDQRQPSVSLLSGNHSGYMRPDERSPTPLSAVPVISFTRCANPAVYSRHLRSTSTVSGQHLYPTQQLPGSLGLLPVRSGLLAGKGLCRRLRQSYLRHATRRPSRRRAARPSSGSQTLYPARRLPSHSAAFLWEAIVLTFVARWKSVVWRVCLLTGKSRMYDRNHRVRTSGSQAPNGRRATARHEVAKANNDAE